jgi:hypothetical protein
MPSVDFSYFPQPESNHSNSVSKSLDAIRNAHDDASAHEAYDEFLWAMGNNHAGTYYPVVLAVLPHVEQILTDGGLWAQRAAMESLIDLGGTFAPEEGHQTYLGASVQETLREFIRSLRPRFALLVGAPDARAKSASELIDLIDDQAN